MRQISFWERETFFAPQDILIIGSGFCGLWCALYLKTAYPHRKITILERGPIPTGASTRNAGFSCFGSPSELLQDARMMGEDKMWQLVEKRFRGLQYIREFFDASAIGYDGSGGHECFSPESADWENCFDQIGYLNKGLEKITGQPATFEVKDEWLPAFGMTGFTHLISNPFEGGVHAGKLVQGLLQKIQGMGVQVLTGTEVIGFTKNAGGYLVETNQCTFNTTQLLLCTNAFTQTLLPELDIIPNRGQVLITEPIPGLKMKGAFHYDQGYYYFRNVGNRLLIGGARNKDFDNENTTTIATTSVIQEELEDFIRIHLLKDLEYTVSDRWSGIMAMGSEKTPIVQSLGEGLFCCVRMSGMGVALAPVVAQEITRWMD